MMRKLYFCGLLNMSSPNMTGNTPINPRKSPRANWIDYDCGSFFITICTKNKIHYFGEIYNGEMHLSEIGEFVNRELQNPNIHFPNIEIPLYVVMPNHIHAIILCSEKNSLTINRNPERQRNPNPSQRTFVELKRHVPALSRYIASMKAAVSRFGHTINPDFGWQPRYHDHAIRGIKDGNNIACYIETNVARWDSDCFYD